MRSNGSARGTFTALFFLAIVPVAAASCTATLRDDSLVTPSQDGGGGDAGANEEEGPAADDASADAKKLADAASADAAKKDGGIATGDGSAYASVESLSGAAFRSALHDLIANHTSLGYDAARDVMLGVTGTFDLSGGMLECIYTGRKVAPDGSRTPNGFNTEHSWPQSLGAGSEPARSDLHHLFPVDELANSARGNLPFANTDCTTSCGFNTGGSREGPIVGGGIDVFQVRDARRGDIARALFYFAVRYSQSLDAFEETALRSWHDADPPDAMEQTRNDAIEGYQNNRNPFVDRPDFVGKISDF